MTMDNVKVGTEFIGFTMYPITKRPMEKLVKGSTQAPAQGYTPWVF